MSKKQGVRGIQLSLFDEGQGQCPQIPSHVTEPVSTLTSRLSDQRVSTLTLLDHVMDHANLLKAYKRVVSNGGSCGVDGMEVNDLGPWLREHLASFRSSVLSGSYEVSAVLGVDIPKPGGGTRRLGIPTVKDRLLQQAIHQILSRYYEPHFSDHSHGYRPLRSCHTAIRMCQNYVGHGRIWMVKVDLKSFFDQVPHDRLMTRLSKGIGDKRLLRLIDSFLKAGMLSGGLSQLRQSGTPQGGPLSPLLSNIVLDELDRALEERGHTFCRYADDCVVFVGSRKAGNRVLKWMLSFIEQKMKLQVNREKSGVYHCDDTDYLGFTLLSNGLIRVSDASLSRFKDKVRKLTRHQRGIPLERVIGELNALIKGWHGYFKLANGWLGRYRDLDGWLRRRLRCYRLKQAGRFSAIIRLLKSLGVEGRRAGGMVRYSQGWWAMSRNTTISKAMGIDWFCQQGLLMIHKR